MADYIDQIVEYESEEVQGKHCSDVSIRQARLNYNFSRSFGDEKVTTEQVENEMRLTMERCTNIEKRCG